MKLPLSVMRTLFGWRSIPLIATFTSTAWEADAAWGTWLQTSVTSPIAYIPFSVPEGVKILEVEAVVDGNAGGTGHGALPATMPKIILYRLDYETGAPVSLGDVTDPSASVAAYHLVHKIQITGLSELTSRQRSYVVQVSGEQGANSAVDALMLLGLRYKMGPP